MSSHTGPQAQILSDSTAQKKLGKVGHKKGDVPVMFFGTLEIAWIGPPEVQPFKQGIQQGMHERGKLKTFLKALTQVATPTSPSPFSPTWTDLLLACFGSPPPSAYSRWIPPDLNQYLDLTPTPRTPPTRCKSSWPSTEGGELLSIGGVEPQATVRSCILSRSLALHTSPPEVEAPTPPAFRCAWP